MDPDEVRKTGKGSCHDQVVYEMAMLKKMGLSPNALFVMENSGDRGGMTHSLVYFNKNGKVYWLENAWEDRAGIHEYDSVDAIKRDIQRAHAFGEFGNKKQFSELLFGDFNAESHKTGETLQELVDKIKWT